MKNKSFLILFFFIDLQSKTEIDYGGYIRLDTFCDQRQMVADDNGVTPFYPAPIECDAQCGDINSRGDFGMSSEVSTLYVKTKTELDNVTLFGHIENDFTGPVYLGTMYIRYAYLKAVWERFLMVIGYAKFPFVEVINPHTVGWDGGNPIAPWSYQPQIRLCYKPHDIQFLVSPYVQFNYAATGPEGEIPTYAQNSMTPGIYSSLEYMTDKTHIGIGFNMERILPSLSTTTTSTTSPERTYASNETLTSFLGTIYAKIKTATTKTQAQVLVGQNGFDLSLLGGYAVKCMNPVSGKRSYTNVNFASGFIDFDWKRYQTLIPGFFIGYAKNLGTRESIYLDSEGKPIFYGFDENIDAVFHFSPRIWSKFNDIELGFEAAFTTAWYGNMNCKAKMPSTYHVSNLRFLIVSIYRF